MAFFILNRNVLSNKKIEQALENLKLFEPKDGYYVAFSGGKDSIVAYDLTKRAGVKFDVHHSITTIDPPEVNAFIKREYPEVIREKPELSMFQLVEKKGLPTRLSRFCCEHLKENGGNERLVITGVRSDESHKRKDRALIYKDTRPHFKKAYLNIIIDWNEGEVWNYIYENNLKYPPLYDSGCMNRVGCVGCPLTSPKQIKIEFAKYPHIEKGYKKAIKKGMENGKYKKFVAAGLDENDIFNWWIKQTKAYDFIEAKNQQELF